VTRERGEARRTFDAVSWERATGGGSWIFTRSIDLVAETARRLVPSGATVLDLGCGPGRLAQELAASGFRVTGVDHDRAMLAAAGSGRGAGVPGLARADLHALPFRSGGVAACVAVSVLGCVPRPAEFLAEARRVLQPGGVFIVTATNRESLLLRIQYGLVNRGLVARPEGAAPGIRAYTAAETRELLRNAGFRVEDTAHYNFVVETGSVLWPGRSMARRLDRAGRGGGRRWARNLLVVGRAE